MRNRISREKNFAKVGAYFSVKLQTVGLKLCEENDSAKADFCYFIITSVLTLFLHLWHIYMVAIDLIYATIVWQLREQQVLQNVKQSELNKN